MRKIIESNTVSSLMRLVLLAGLLHFAANRSQAQSEVFDNEVIQKWKDYEAFSQQIQGTVLRTSTRLPDRNFRSDVLRYKQNRECVLQIFPGRNPDEELCSVDNPQYNARVKRSASDPNSAILIQYDPRLSGESNTEARSAKNGVFFATSPHFSYTLTRLSKLVVNPSFQVTKVAPESYNGHDLIRVDHIYNYNVPRSKNNLQHRIRGSLYFEPSRCWCLRRYKKSVDVMYRGERNSSWEYEVDFETIDHLSGFPLVKRQNMRQIQFNYKNKKKIEITSKSDYDIEVKEGPPNSEFTLTAFGLPEPGSEPMKKTVSLYVWILIAAGICAVLALGFRYLAHRRTPPQPAA